MGVGQSNEVLNFGGVYLTPCTERGKELARIINAKLANGEDCKNEFAELLKVENEK